MRWAACIQPGVGEEWEIAWADGEKNACCRVDSVGHVERMQDTAIPKKMLYATRRRGRPKMRWLDDVSMDLRKMGVSRWRDRARNREAWRRVAEEAKAHPRL
jgi:hypothetical protein